jgi:hypothetical protein
LGYSVDTTKSKQFVVKNIRADPKLVPLIIHKPGNPGEGSTKISSLQASLTSFKVDSGANESNNVKLLIERNTKVE